MSSKKDVELINEELKKRYGCDLQERPKFRIVWSEDQLTKRFGTFELTTKNGIFIRSETGVREVKKYSYMKDRWVLETLSPFAPPEEEKDYNGYEPIWQFESALGIYLEPNLRAAILICDSALRGPKRKTQADINAEEEEAYAKEVEFFYEYLQQHGRSETFAEESAVVISDTSKWERS